MAQSDYDDYLGTADPERVGHKIVERFKKWRERLGQTGAYAQWSRNYSQYMNGPAELGDEDDPWSESFALEGDSAEVLSVRVNEMRNLITHILNLTYSKPVGSRAVAEAGNEKSLQAAMVADALLEEDFRAAGGTKLMRRLGEGALVVSTTFAMAEWDFSAGQENVPDGPAEDPGASMQMSGAPNIVDFWIDEVCFDTTKKDWRNVYDVVLLRRYNRFELASRHPEQEDEILQAPRINQSPYCGFRDKLDESEDVFVFEYLHRRVNGRFLPEGRRTLCLEGGEVLSDGPNPYAGLSDTGGRPELNVYPVTAAQGLGGVYGYAIANDLSPLNRMVNLCATIMATNLAAWGSPNLTGPPLSMTSVQNLVGGARYFASNAGQGDIKPLSMLPDLKPIMEVMAAFSSQGEKIGGVGNIMRGETGDMSGVAIAQAKSMVVQFMSSFQESVVEQHESVCNALIWLRRTFSTGKQKVAKLGAEHTQEVLEYDAQETLGNIARVRSEAIDPVMSTPEGREARAQTLMSMNAFTAPWQYLTLIKTGRDDTLFAGPMARNLLITRENAWMMKGKKPLVLQGDDHPKHIQEHTDLLADPEVRSSSQIVGGVLEHNALHTMYAMGLTPLQGEDPQTGQPYPSAIVQLEQAKQMAAQQQQQAAMQQAPQAGAGQGAPQDGGAPQIGMGAPPGAQLAQAAPTAQESLQQGAMAPGPN